MAMKRAGLRAEMKESMTVASLVASWELMKVYHWVGQMVGTLDSHLAEMLAAGLEMTRVAERVDLTEHQ